MKRLLILLLLLSSSLFANIGTIMAMKGSALVERAGANVDALTGMELLEGDTIVTESKSRVQVMLKDETVVTIGAKSTFSFDEYSFDGAESKVSMKASRGFFRSVTGRIGKLAPQRFKVKTASATIGIRGTDFWGITGGARELVTCNKGAISIEFDGKVIEVDAGHYAAYGAKGVEQGKAGSAKDGDDAKGEKKGANGKDDDKKSPKGAVIEKLVVELGMPEIDISASDLADVVQQIENTLEAFDITISEESRPQEY